MKKLIISGACGKMGRMIAQEAPEQGFEIACGVDRAGEAYAGFPLFPDFGKLPAADVLIDFSSPANLTAVLDYAKASNTPCVLGTTGYTDEDMALVTDASRTLPIFRSSNMSLGVYVLTQLAKQAAALLPGFDIEIIEKHHNQKADSPSGTALSLLDAVRDENSKVVFGREGKTCRRQTGEIGVHAVRGGTVPGEHEVGFYGSYEVLSLSHSAQSRLIFALGALKAALFITNQAPGLYSMDALFSQMVSGNHQP